MDMCELSLFPLNTKLEIVCSPVTIHIALHCIYNYLHCTYIVFNNMSSRDYLKYMADDVCTWYANTVSFYTRLKHPLILVTS